MCTEEGSKPTTEEKEGGSKRYRRRNDYLGMGKFSSEARWWKKNSPYYWKRMREGKRSGRENYLITVESAIALTEGTGGSDKAERRKGKTSIRRPHPSGLKKGMPDRGRIRGGTKN